MIEMPSEAYLAGYFFGWEASVGGATDSCWLNVTTKKPLFFDGSSTSGSRH
jgi:hypothetical protein